uniref:Uncharacterized protein n=1 Tax=Strigamia maritima TaxID=126957 RepID=T1JMJ6_STRMM
MADMDEIESVKKLMEIGVVRNAKETLTRFYFDVKSGNGFVEFWCNSAEKTCVLVYNGSYPLLRIFNTPIRMADSCACAVLESAQHNLPLLLEVPVNTLATGCLRFVNSSIGQFALSSADTMLFVAEKTISFIPGISIIGANDSGAADVDKTHFIEPIKTIYNVLTYPLQITIRLVHASRNTIQQIQNQTSVEVNVFPPEEDKKKQIGLIARIAHLPLRGLHFVGMLAEKRSILRRQNSCEVSDISFENCQKEIESVDRKWKVLDDLEAEYEKEEMEIAESEENSDEELDLPAAPIRDLPKAPISDSPEQPELNQGENEEEKVEGGLRGGGTCIVHTASGVVRRGSSFRNEAQTTKTTIPTTTDIGQNTFCPILAFQSL